MILMNRTHFCLTVNTSTSCKAGLHVTNSDSCTVWLPREFQGFTSRINSYHSLVPGLISIFRDGMGPFNMQ